jgi:hypothetical protein
VATVPAEFKAAAESGAVLAIAQVGQPLAVTVTVLRFAVLIPRLTTYIGADGVHLAPA